MEISFAILILRAKFKYQLFKTFFTFFRLLWQALAILFWLIMCLLYSSKKYSTNDKGLRQIEVKEPFSTLSMEVRMQRFCLLGVFIALAFELIHALH
jgi:hypothetical protein